MDRVSVQDVQDLASLGYRQKLDRTLGSFSAFAAGFSYLSILTGLFQMFHEGFGRGGPAFFWTWPVVFAGQLLVALCFAELAAQYPLSGGVYQWAKLAGSRPLGWITGWVYLASLIISISAVALALQVTLPQIGDQFQLIGDKANPADQAANAVLLGCLLIGMTTLINSVGVRLLAAINNLGVLSELIGAVCLIFLLAVRSRRGPEIVLDTAGKGAGSPLGYGAAFLAAGLTASYIMYGFDTAGALAEETRDPRRRAPWAILQALTACAATGLLLMLFALMAVSDFEPVARDGLPYVVKDVLGEDVGKGFLWDVIFAITVCALAVHTSTVRLMFAMARDNHLPFGRALARISDVTRVPVVPALVGGGLAAGILVVNLQIPGFLDLTAPTAIIWANLAYLLVTGTMLAGRLAGRGAGARPPREDKYFSLGRWGLLVNGLAVVWSVALIANLAWPREDVYGPEWYQRFGPLYLTAALLLAGGVCYHLFPPGAGHVLEDHKA